VLRDGKLFGFYVLDAALAHEPKICGGRIVIGDPREEQRGENEMFTFFIGANLAVLFVNPRPSPISIGKPLTAQEAKNHPKLRDVLLIIDLALAQEKIITEHLRS
jgi:hypothetical protein